MASASNLLDIKYVVKGVLKSHTSDVRVVKAARVPEGGFITGSRDTLVKLWVPTEDNSYKDEFLFMGATKFIASLCALPVSVQYPDGLILAGSNDCSIYGFTPKSPFPVLKLLGHSNAVCSLSAGFGLFVSGSWDGTARVWSGQQCTAVLEGHGETVWSTEVYPLQNIILTGSADRTIRIWREGVCEKVLYGHQDCIRGLVVTADLNILSCSNDTTVRLWNIQGECLNVFQSHNNYIYSITLLGNGIDFATCSEDEFVKIWKDGTCVQSIKIPKKTLWSVAYLNNGDLAVGCSDGAVYMLGKSDGESGCSGPCGDRETETAQALSGRALNLNSDFGNVELDLEIKPQKKKDFEVFMELGDKEFKLELDRNDDPYKVALEFAKKHNLDSSYIDDILDCIVKSCDSKVPPKPNEFFPLKNYYTYVNGNISGLKAKLLEFSICVPKSQCISPEGIEELVLLASYPEEVSERQMQDLDTVITWSDDYLYPALDLLRLAVRCRDIGVKVGTPGFINHLLHILRTTKKSVNRVLVIKILCNLFEIPEGEELVLSFQGKIFDTVKEVLSHDNITHKSASSLYLNYSIAAYRGITLDKDAYCSTLLEMLKVVVDSDSLYKGFIAIGTICVAQYSIFLCFNSWNIYEVLLGCQKHVENTNACAVWKVLLKSFHP